MNSPQPAWFLTLNYRLGLALLLSGLLAGTGSLPDMAQADGIDPSPSLDNIVLLAEATPTAVVDAAKTALATQQGIPLAQLQLVQAKAMTWPDGCLGLAQPDEFCTQALVNGWQIELTNGQRNWVYRSDRTGKTLRLDSSSKATEKVGCTDSPSGHKIPTL